MPTKIILTDAQIKYLRDDFDSGMTINGLAKKYNMSVMTLRPILKNLGMKRIGRITQVEIDSVLINREFHISKISAITGLDNMTIQKILKLNNISPARKQRKKQKLKSISRYDELKSSYDIAQMTELLNNSIHYATKVTGFSDLLIKRYASEFNLHINKTFTKLSDISEDTFADIREKYMSRLYTNYQICELFEIGSRTFRKIIVDIELEYIPLDAEFIKYTRVVRRLTEVVKNLYDLQPNTGHHIDHKISVYDGYKLGIPAYLIASFENLQEITITENLKKGSSSSITKDELYKLLNL